MNRELGSADSEARTLATLAVVNDREQRYDEAVEQGMASLAIFHQGGRRSEEAGCRYQLGLAVRATGDVGLARAHWREALEIHEDLGLPEAEVRAALAELPPDDVPGATGSGS